MSHRTRNPEGLATGPEYARNHDALCEIEDAMSRLSYAGSLLTNGDDISPVSEEIAESLDALRDEILDGPHTRIRRRLYGIESDPYTSGSEEDEDGEEKRRPNPPVVQDALDAQRTEDVLEVAKEAADKLDYLWANDVLPDRDLVDRLRHAVRLEAQRTDGHRKRANLRREIP